jgi:hypothetical protein
LQSNKNSIRLSPMDEEKTAQITREATPVDHALDHCEVDFEHLLKVVEGGDLDHYDDVDYVGFMQKYERMRNRMALVDHRVIRDGVDRKLPETLTQKSMQRVLTSALRISEAEASRRVRAAEKVGDRVSMRGEPLAPVRARLAAAQRAGEVSPEQANIILTGLAKVDRPGFDPADVDAAEQLLTGFAASFGPTDLKLLTNTVIDRINPDGSKPNDELNRDRRHLRLRARADGSYDGEFRLTGPLGAKLTAVLGPLAKPRVNTMVGPDGRLVEAPDERTHGQRMHDALEDVCDRMLRATGLPDSGGTPASVVVTIGLDDLLAKTGFGTTSDGAQISAREVLKLANQAEILPAVLSTGGAVLDLGRTRRIASPTQTMALIARDGGCSFPTCTHPPEWSERHHIRAWVDGGLTNLDNLTLLCGYHHHNFAIRGWTCGINADGLPAWTPPRWVDRSQTPMINHRILGAIARR